MAYCETLERVLKNTKAVGRGSGSSKIPHPHPSTLCIGLASKSLFIDALFRLPFLWVAHCFRFSRFLLVCQGLLRKKKYQWLPQQVWTEATWNSYETKLVWFELRCRRPLWPWRSMSNRICNPIPLWLESQARWIRIKRSHLVSYFSMEKPGYRMMFFPHFYFTFGIWN